MSLKLGKFIVNYNNFLAFSLESQSPWAAESIFFIKKFGAALRRVSGDPRLGQKFFNDFNFA